VASIAALVRLTHPDPPADVDEDALLARCREGDAGALRLLYERHARVVMTYARRLGLSADEAEDVAQEVFGATFKDLKRIQPGALSSWLYRLTSNRVNDRFRRRRVRETFSRWFGAAEPVEDPATRPDHVALQRDAERRVGRILAPMSQKKRDVFVLFELQGLSGEEIAECLEIPVDTVWTRLHHARIEFAKVGRSLELLEETRCKGVSR
jgi:RNA polymerase sigma-70 factor (ECF subfamily)